MYALNLPINPVSFGQVSYGILRRIHELGHTPCLFPIGNVDVSAFHIENDFKGWLEQCLNKSLKSHKRNVPIFKLWHLMQSLESFSDKQTLLTFYELDSPTEEELNTIRNTYRILVTNAYSKTTLELCGCDNVVNIPLFFDKYHFVQNNKRYFTDDRITFNVVGKFEYFRKNHPKLIQTWVKRFGNNPQYFLNCAVYNQFMSQEDNQRMWFSLFDKRYFNVNYIGYMNRNELYNDFLNSADVVIGMGTEGWGLPEFHSVAMGKHGLLLNCAGYKEWANNNNAVLINPSSKVEVYDNLFFRRGAPYNQGNVFTFSEDEFIWGCEEIIKRVMSSRVNTSGLDLQNVFTVDKTVDMILNNIAK